jgi:tetratricopeptide (TPR) repeat protein
MKISAMFYLLFLSGALLVNTQSFAAATPKKKKGKDTKVRKEMNTISSHIRDLGLYIASEQEFLKESNKQIIQKHLEQLTSLFKNLKVHPVIDSQGLSLNQAVMSEQLEQTLALFKNDKKSLARAKFNAALNLCVSCHTQGPALSKAADQEDHKVFAEKDISKLKINDYERAELYFITRDFDEAMKLYDQFLKNSKKTDDDEYIYKALERELIYYVKIKKDFPAAKEHFEAFLKDNHFNDKVNQEVSDWIKTLSGKSLWDQFDPKTTKEEDMEKFMKTFIADDEEGPIFSLTNSSEVNDLNLSSILIDYYNAHPETKLGAKILYWMATLDKRVSDDLFFSLGDYYLIACMEKYPKDPIAKDCYESYVDDLEINYLGKDKELQNDIKSRLKRLQKLIDYQEEE